MIWTKAGPWYMESSEPAGYHVVKSVNGRADTGMLKYTAVRLGKRSGETWDGSVALGTFAAQNTIEARLEAIRQCQELCELDASAGATNENPAEAG